MRTKIGKQSKMFYIYKEILYNKVIINNKSAKFKANLLKIGHLKGFL